jgi:hypothetical protein
VRNQEDGVDVLSRSAIERAIHFFLITRSHTHLLGVGTFDSSGRSLSFHRQSRSQLITASRSGGISPSDTSSSRIWSLFTFLNFHADIRVAFNMISPTVGSDENDECQFSIYTTLGPYANTNPWIACRIWNPSFGWGVLKVDVIRDRRSGI